MSFPLTSFDSKRSHNRPKLLNTSIQQFNWNELSDKDVIGSGSFGSVITAKYNGKSIVVKQLLEQHERNLRLFYKEANILHSLDDKRIVKLHAVCQSPPAMMLELVYFDFSPFGLERRVFSLKDFINFLSSEDGITGTKVYVPTDLPEQLLTHKDQIQDGGFVNALDLSTYL